MSGPTYRSGESFEFALPDTGSGGETRTATDVARNHDYVVTVLLRDHYCPLSRRLVQSLADAYEGFAGRSTAVVPVLPDAVGRASVWQRRYDLPFGLLSDMAGDGPTADDVAADDEAGDGFEVFDPFETVLPGLPGAVLFEADGETLRFVRTVRCDRGRDGPPVDDVLKAIDDHASDGVVDPGRTGPGVERVSEGQ